MGLVRSTPTQSSTSAPFEYNIGAKSAYVRQCLKEMPSYHPFADHP